MDEALGTFLGRYRTVQGMNPASLVLPFMALLLCVTVTINTWSLPRARRLRFLLAVLAAGRLLAPQVGMSRWGGQRTG